MGSSGQSLVTWKCQNTQTKDQSAKHKCKHDSSKNMTEANILKDYKTQTNTLLKKVKISNSPALQCTSYHNFTEET
jgi:hypothetical protein